MIATSSPDPESDPRVQRDQARQRAFLEQLGEDLATLREELAATEAALEATREELARCRARLEAVYTSRTWRTGAGVLWIPKRLRAWRRR